MKPVELIERAIQNSSKSRDTILDPFGGSGSTLIACEKTGRQVRLIELDAKYVDVSIIRWQEYTGRSARSEIGDRTSMKSKKRGMGVTDDPPPTRRDGPPEELPETHGKLTG